MKKSALLIKSANFFAQLKVSDMSDMNQMDTHAFMLKPCWFNPQEAASKVINVMLKFQKKDVKFVLKVSKGIQMVRCDLQRFQQVLLNMLTHACQKAKTKTIICVELYTLSFKNSPQKSTFQSLGRAANAIVYDTY